MIKKDRLINYYLYLFVFFPLFPSIMNRSQVHINILGVFVFFIVFFIYRDSITLYRKKKLLIYFSILQLFLIASYIFGRENASSISELISLFRPAMLFLFFYSMITLLRYNEIEKIYNIIKSLKLIVVVCFFTSLIEIFNPPIITDLFYFVYKISDKADIKNVSVTFFSLPYYSALFYNFCLVLFLTSKDSFKNRFFQLIYVSILLMCIVLAQSKTGVASAIFVIFMYWFFQLSRKSKIITILCLIAGGTVIYSFIMDFIIYLNDNFSGNLVRTLYDIFYDTSNSGTLQLRLEQVSMALSLIFKNNYFFGVGLGRDVLLESWLSTALYRYGLIGVIFIILCFLYVLLRSYFFYSYMVKKKYQDSNLLLITPLWFVSLFFTQISSLSIEISKGALINTMAISIGISIFYSFKETISLDKKENTI